MGFMGADPKKVDLHKHFISKYCEGIKQLTHEEFFTSCFRKRQETKRVEASRTLARQGELIWKSGTKSMLEGWI